MTRKASLMLSILGIISIVLITVGITYAFFNYSKTGSSENVISSGTITFIYEEVEKNGSGISIENAYPVSDDTGKNQKDAKEVFNFTIKSSTYTKMEIPYTITARKKVNSTLDENAVKLYLTEVSGETETQLAESIYESLPDYTNRPDGVSEKVLYSTKVPEESNNYVKNYRLRMWIPSTIDFSPVEDNEGNVTYPYNGKIFTVTVNVYANGKVVTVPEQPIAYYAFGLPTTASSTSFLDVITESGSNTLVKLEEEQLSVCIYRNEILECFKNNNYEEEIPHLSNVFGEVNCVDDGSSYKCYDGDLSCFAISGGNVRCYDNAAGFECHVGSSGDARCN